MRNRFLIILFTLTIALQACHSHAVMYEYQSRHYKIQTDLDLELALEIALRMDAMYREYSARLVDFGTSDRSVEAILLIYTNADDYHNLPGMEPNSGGVFIPAQNTVATYLGQRAKMEMFQTLQHEAFHQFSHHFIANKLPIWLEEGLAEVFAEAIWTGNSFLFGQVRADRASRVRDLAARGKFMDVKSAMNVSASQWNEWFKNEAHAGLAYDQAWAMVHFLAFGTDGNGSIVYRPYFLRMLSLLHAGKSQEGAFAEAFNGNYGGFQSRFNAWIPSLKPTPLATCIDNQLLLGRVVAILHQQNTPVKTLDELKRELTTRRWALTASDGSSTSIEALFQHPDGRPLIRDELYFESRSREEHPDLVYRCAPNVVLRTRFRQTADTVTPNLTIEMPR